MSSRHVPHLLKHQPEEAVNRLRVNGYKCGDQSNPDLADDAFELATTAKSRENPG